MRIIKNKKVGSQISTVISAIFVLVVALSFSGSKTAGGDAGAVLGQSTNVHAFIPSLIKFKVYPEKRIPAVGNWDTFADIKLRDCSTGAVKYSFVDVPTDADGIGTIDSLDTPIASGNYRIEIIGYSHLNKNFPCRLVSSSEEYVDLTQDSAVLLAGEVSNVYDNYINSLDISVLVNQLYNADYLTDLNQDSKVNSLDISIQIYNLFKFGDV